MRATKEDPERKHSEEKRCQDLKVRRRDLQAVRREKQRKEEDEKRQSRGLPPKKRNRKFKKLGLPPPGPKTRRGPRLGGTPEERAERKKQKRRERDAAKIQAKKNAGTHIGPGKFVRTAAVRATYSRAGQRRYLSSQACRTSAGVWGKGAWSKKLKEDSRTDVAMDDGMSIADDPPGSVLISARMAKGHQRTSQQGEHSSPQVRTVGQDGEVKASSAASGKPRGGALRRLSLNSTGVQAAKAGKAIATSAAPSGFSAHLQRGKAVAKPSEGGLKELQAPPHRKARKKRRR